MAEHLRQVRQVKGLVSKDLRQQGFLCFSTELLSDYITPHLIRDLFSFDLSQCLNETG